MLTNVWLKTGVIVLALAPVVSDPSASCDNGDKKPPPAINRKCLAPTNADDCGAYCPDSSWCGACCMRGKELGWGPESYEYCRTGCGDSMLPDAVR
jgi:hypothetical protein